MNIKLQLEFVNALNEIEKRALKFGLECYTCGALTNSENMQNQRYAMNELTETIDDFRNKIIKELDDESN